jgi:hypothetical protein
MSVLRRIEMVCGIATGALGLATLAFALGAPLVTTESGGCTTGGSPEGITTTCTPSVTGHTSVIANQGLVSLLPAILIFGSILLAIVGFALAHSRGGAGTSLTFLWIFTALLWAAMVLTGFSIGLFFFPTSLLALVTAILASMPDRRHSPAPSAAAG